MKIPQVSQALPQGIPDRRVSYIGHGQLESAPETFSALHVISHELGHVQEFRREAIQEGKTLDSVQVKIQYEMRDGRLVAVSGETRALTRSGKQEETQSTYSDGKSQLDFLKAQREEMERVKEKPEPSESEKAREAKNLENKLKELETKLSPVEQRMEDPFAKGNETDPKTQELEREKRRLEEELRLLKMQEQLKESFDMLVDFRKRMTSNLFGMISLTSSRNVGSQMDIFA